MTRIPSMSLYTKLDGIRRNVRSGFVSRVIAVLLGGSLNQKVVVVIGGAFVVYALYTMLVNLWPPLLVGAVGLVIVHFALRDYERSSGTRM